MKAILLCTTFFIFQKKLDFMVRGLLKKIRKCIFLEFLQMGWMGCSFRLFFKENKKVLHSDIALQTYWFFLITKIFYSHEPS